jgi:hypothetical protein
MQPNDLVKTQATVNMKKSTITPREADGTVTVPKLVLASSSREAIGREEQQPIAISTTYPLPPPHGRRKATRYQFNSMATIRWLGVDEQIHQSFGIVRDMSISGVFVESTAPLCLNANVELEMTTPGLLDNSSRPEFQFEGKVVRAVNHNGCQGFAIAGYLSIPRLTDLDDESLSHTAMF